MASLHRLLRRQVQKQFGGIEQVPEELLPFIRGIDQAYRDADADRGMLERSLDLSSKELFEANSEMRAIFGALPDVIVRIDSSGTILDVKSGAEGELLLSRGDLVGRRLQDGPLLQSSGDLTELIATALSQQRPSSCVYSLEVEGEMRHYELRLFPFMQDHLIGIIGNVTGLRRAEAELRATNEKLVDEIRERQRAEEERRTAEERASRSEKLESLGVLAGGIAHEINTPTQYVGDNTRFFQQSFQDLMGLIEPLQAVVSAARLGAVPEELLSEAERAVTAADLEYVLAETPVAIEQALEGVNRVTRIVQAMKDFSHVSMEQTPTDLQAAIMSTATVASNEWKYVAELVTDFDENLPPVHCVPDRLNQVLLNLIVNAAHAIDEARGPGSEDKGRITVRTRQKGDLAEIVVEDTGVGMSDDVKGRIFDPFYTTKPLGRGTGQGLSVAHAVVVKEHGGSIAVESTPGEGSVFTLSVPIQGPRLTDVASK